jgi:hypothetical protein
VPLAPDAPLAPEAPDEPEIEPLEGVIVNHVTDGFIVAVKLAEPLEASATVCVSCEAMGLVPT